MKKQVAPTSYANIGQAVRPSNIDRIRENAIYRFGHHRQVDIILQELHCGRVESEIVLKVKIESPPWENAKSLNPLTQIQHHH